MAKGKFGLDYYLLILANAFVGIAFYAVQPVLTKYLVGLGTTIAIASVVAGLFSFTALTVRPFTGAIADRISPKSILKITVPLLMISVFGYPLTNSIPIIVILRIINGVSFCFNGTAITALAADYIPDGRMGEGIGYLGLGTVLATAIGPNIGISVGERFGYRYSFVVAGIFAVLALLTILCVNEKKNEDKKENINKANSPLKVQDIIAFSLLPLALLNGFFSYANGTITNFLVIFSDERGIVGCSVYFTAVAVFVFVLRPLTGKITDKHGIGAILIPAYVISIMGILMIAFANKLWMILLAAPFIAFGQGGGQPAIQAECIRVLGKEKRGVATSTYYIFADVFQGLGPVAGGFLADEFGVEMPFYFSAGILALGFLLFLYLHGIKKRKYNYCN